ncbi:MAG: DUF4258 domain-containing protein [Candidatus Poribacteria bacterium]|nr:DUF4258 domain-containing protein [Candidatus Poribacteria bacterium]
MRRSRILQLIRQKITDNFYQITQHAKDEMHNDALSTVDVKNAIRRGRIVQRLTHDPRGIRYVLSGPARDGREINVVCRILDSGKLRIITVYAIRGTG